MTAGTTIETTMDATIEEALDNEIAHLENSFRKQRPSNETDAVEQR
jgi:hypothetical protein